MGAKTNSGRCVCFFFIYLFIFFLPEMSLECIRLVIELGAVKRQLQLLCCHKCVSMLQVWCSKCSIEHVGMASSLLESFDFCLPYFAGKWKSKRNNSKTWQKLNKANKCEKTKLIDDRYTLCLNKWLCIYIWFYFNFFELSWALGLKMIIPHKLLIFLWNTPLFIVTFM